MERCTLAASRFKPQLFSEECLADPYPVYQQLLRDAPLHHTDLFGGAWLAASHQLAKALLQDPRLTNNTLNYMKAAFSGEQQRALQPLVDFHATWLPYLRQSEHTEVRKVMHRLMESSISSCRQRFVACAQALVNALPESGQFDLVVEYATLFPAYTICDILGVEAAKTFDIIKWSNHYHEYIASDMTSYALAMQALDALQSIEAYFNELLSNASKLKPESLLKAIHAIVPKAVDRTLLLHQLSNFVVAGYVNAHNTIANALFSLISNPEKLAQLRTMPNLYKTAVKELIRFETSTQLVPRRALEAVSDYGVQIAEGNLVFILIGAANRDPAVFSNPNQLDLARKKNPHLTFGYGPHTCIGLHLSYVTLEIALKAFINRYSEHHLTIVDYERQRSIAFRGFDSLDIVVNRQKAKRDHVN